MAESKSVVIDVSVKGTGEAINSVKQLKDELKKAQSAALNGDGAAAKRVAELRDKMDDLKDSTKSLQGSGVEKIQNSFGLLGQGLKDFDFDKIKTGFKGVGSAMAAIPIFAIVTGITYLIEHFDELSKGNGVLAKTLRAVGDALSFIGSVIGKVVDYFTDMAGATSDATRALDKQGEAIKTNADKMNAALAAQTAAFDRQIALAKASGKSTVEYEQAKQQAIIDTNLLIAKQIEAFVRAGGELDDEKKKQLTASLDFIANAKVQERVIEETDHKEKLTASKKYSDDKKAQSIKDAEDLYAELTKNEDIIKAQNDARKAEEDKIKLDEQNQRIKSLEDLKNLSYKKDLEEIAAFTDKEAKKTQAEKAANEARLSLTRTALTSTQAVSDIFFNSKLAKLKKGSAEEEQVARKAFNVNKALQLGLATLDGYKAITASLAAAPLAIGVIPNPVGIASLASAIATTGINIAKIASSQFGGGGQSSTPDVGGVTGGGGTPNIQTSTAPTIAPPSRQASTELDENGRIITPKAYVVESEITTSQNRIRTTEDRASH